MSQYIYINETANVFVRCGKLTSMIFNDETNTFESSLTRKIVGIVKLSEQHEKELKYSDETKITMFYFADEKINERYFISPKALGFNQNEFEPEISQYEIHLTSSIAVKKSDLINFDKISQEQIEIKKSGSAFYYVDDLMTLWSCGKNTVDDYVRQGLISKPYRHKKSEKKRWLKSEINKILGI